MEGPITDILDYYGVLWEHERDGWVHVHCHFCNHDNPKMGVSLEGGGMHCFHCDEGGHISRYLEQFYGAHRDHIDTVLGVVGAFNPKTTRRDKMTETKPFEIRHPFRRLGERGWMDNECYWNFFNRRGFSDDEVQHLWDVNNGLYIGLSGMFKDTILHFVEKWRDPEDPRFPEEPTETVGMVGRSIYGDVKLEGIALKQKESKKRAKEKKAKAEGVEPEPFDAELCIKKTATRGAGVRRYFWNGQYAVGGKHLILVEGMFDGFRMQTAKDRGELVIASLGKPTKLQKKLLPEIAVRYDKVLVLLDRDARKEAEATAALIPNGIVGELPEGIDDPAEMTQQQAVACLEQNFTRTPFNGATLF